METAACCSQVWLAEWLWRLVYNRAGQGLCMQGQGQSDASADTVQVGQATVSKKKFVVPFG